MNTDELKRATGYRAAEYVQSEMVVGLGSGSTARYATLRIAEKVRTGELHHIVGIPTSEATAELARQGGIPLTTLEEQPAIDLTIDGADEVDPQFNLIKGLGGAQLREKIVAYASKCEIIVVDSSKLVVSLGSLAPVPVEVIRFGWRSTMAALERTGGVPTLRIAAGAPFITDEGNYILDCRYTPAINDPLALAAAIKAIPGVVEHGLFLGMAHRVVVASPDGVQVLEKE
ncbi:MAG: ribose-5-phosphate isomerase RpiA [Anaerolineae bacterium]